MRRTSLRYVWLALAVVTVALVLFILGLSRGYSYEQEPTRVVKKTPAHHVA